MTERKMKNEDSNQEEIEKQNKITERKKRLAEKRKIEEANLSDEEKQQLRERRKEAMQKKLEGLSEEDRKKVLEERKKRAKQRKLEEQKRLEEQQKYVKIQEDGNEIVIQNNFEEGDPFIDEIKENKRMKKSSKKSNSVTKNSSKKVDKMQQKINAKKEKLEAKRIKKQNKSKARKIAKIILVMLLILLIIAGVFFGMRIKENGGGMQGIVATMLGHDSSTLDTLPELRFVIVGQSQNLTDTIMICSYNPRSQKASILSIPRDTYTGNNKSKATAYEKINVLYQEKPEKLVSKLNELTGLDLKYYVHVDTNGLVELVDAIGGVEFDVPIDMNYDDTSQKLSIHLKAGTQKLNGKQAEGVLRFRHNNNGSTYPSEYGQEDIGRMKTQREFIKVVINKMAKAENITKVDDFITIANKYIQTNMDFNAFKDYAPYAFSFNSDNVRTETLPGTPEKFNGLWFFTCDKNATKDLVADMFALEPEKDGSTETTTDGTTTQGSETTTNDLSKVNVKGVKVEVLNGTSNSKNLTNVKSKLQKAGFTVSKTGTTSATSKTTIVNRTGKSDDIAAKLKSTVGAGTISSGSDNSKVDFTVVIGSDI